MILCVAYCRPKPLGPREAAPGYQLCWVCKDNLRRHLLELADLAPDLEAALSRANQSGEKVSGSPTRAAELNDTAAAVRWQIHHDMIATIRLVIEERNVVATIRGDSIAGMAKWLANHGDWLAAHPSAAERSDEAAAWPRLARAAINPNPAKYVKIGPCVKPGCTGTLSAVVRPHDSMLPSSIVCSQWAALSDEQREGLDPHEWTADQWHALGRQMQRIGA